MKKLLLTFAVLLGFALPGLAETAVFYVSDYTSTDGYDNKILVESTDFPENDILTGGGFNTVSNTDMRAYANSSFTFTPKESITITKIVFKDTNSKSPTISAKIDGTATTCSTASRITTWEGTLSYSSTLTFSTTAQLRIDHIEITYTKPATGPVDFEPDFKDQTYTVHTGESLDINSLITVNTPPLSHLYTPGRHYFN